MATPTAAPAQPNFEPRSGAPAAWGIVALTVATVLIGALAPGRPAPESAAGKAAPGETACLEWSDGCQICRQLPEGPACSLPGIACTPGAMRCLIRSDGRVRD